MIKILCIGEALSEFDATWPQAGGYPTDPKDLRKIAGDMVPNFAFYAQTTARQLGRDKFISTTVLTAVSPNQQGASVLGQIKGYGSKIHKFTKGLPGTMGRAYNLYRPDGQPDEVNKLFVDRERTPFRDLLNDASDDDLKEIVKGYTHIVISGGTTLACIRERKKLIRLLEYAKQQNPPAKIILGMNARPQNWKMPDNDNPNRITDDSWLKKAQDWFGKVIPMADMMVGSRMDIKSVFGAETTQDAIFALNEMNPRAEIVISNDDGPIGLMHGKNRSYIEIPIAEPTVDIVSVAGCGDCLIGVYAAARMIEMEPIEAVKMASFAAAQVLGEPGGLVPINLRPYAKVAAQYQAKKNGPAL